MMVPRLTWTLLSWRRFPGWRDRLATIRRVAALDADALAAWQAEALRRHLDWAGTSLPFWRAHWRPGARLADLPLLTREIVQARELDLRDPTRDPATLTRETSGGSTGHPVAVWQDLAYRVWDWATEAFVLESWGVEPWARTTYVWGADRDIEDWPARERLLIRLLDRETVNAFRMGEDDLRRAAELLIAHRPTYVQGYATALHLLARWLLEHRPDHGVRPLAVRSSAETLLPQARADVERAFAAPVYDFYGSRESASIAAQCKHGAMHVLAHGCFLEIVDDDGRVAAPGVPGRILVTDLTNRAFGLIRYETGDVAAWSADATPCPCGSAYPTLERILGRTTDFLTTPDGERIHGEWFTHLFYGRAGVSRFQVHQTALDRVEVKTVGPATEADLADVLQAIRHRMGEGVEVVWRAVDGIETTATGKYRFTISDVPFLPESA